MNPFIGELIGTALLVLLGNGVIANVVLAGTKGNNAGWIVTTWGWGMATFVAVFTVAAFSGAHIIPAVTLGLAIAGKFEWGNVPDYILAQFFGAFLVWLFYRAHYAITMDPASAVEPFSRVLPPWQWRRRWRRWPRLVLML